MLPSRFSIAALLTNPHFHSFFSWLVRQNYSFQSRRPSCVRAPFGPWAAAPFVAGALGRARRRLLSQEAMCARRRRAAERKRRARLQRRPRKRAGLPAQKPSRHVDSAFLFLCFGTLPPSAYRELRAPWGSVSPLPRKQQASTHKSQWHLAATPQWGAPSVTAASRGRGVETAVNCLLLRRPFPPPLAYSALMECDPLARPPLQETTQPTDPRATATWRCLCWSVI